MYHYENESFCKIQEYGTQGDGPSYFIETKPDGTKYYYGYTNDDGNSIETNAKILAVGKGESIRVWALSRVEDLYGNYYTITYDQDNGAYYPNTITYTGNTLNDIADKRTIVFEYYNSSERQDYYSNQAYGSTVEYHWLLKSISTNVKLLDGSNCSRTYTLDYNNGTTPYGTTAVKSRLTSVKDSWDESGETKMYYTYASDENNAWENEDEDTGYKLLVSLFVSENTIQIGDFIDINGDGLLDYVVSYRCKATGSSTSNKTKDVVQVYINKDNKFQLDSSGTYTFPTIFAYPVFTKHTYNSYTYYTYVWNSTKLQLSDVNGDGLTDIIAGTTAYINNGNGTNWSTNENYFPASIYVLKDYNGLNPAVGVRADIDGNGLLDCLISYKKGGGEYKIPYLHLYNNSDKTFVWNTSYSNYKISPFFAIATYSSTYGYLWSSSSIRNMVFMDYNNDGYTDYDPVNCDDINLNTGNGWKSASYSLYKVDGYDMNNDGLADKVVSYVNSSNKLIRYTYLNTGYGFVSTSSSEYELPDGVIFNNLHDSKVNKIKILDINGDGLNDIVFNPSVYLRKGTTKKHLLTKVTTPLDGSTNISYEMSTKFTDSISIDGSTDKAIDPTAKTYPYVVNNSPRNLVASVTTNNGIAAISTTDSAPGNYITKYSYDHGMRYSGFPYERKDLYFECVTSQTNGGPYTKTYYNQTYDLAGKIAYIYDYDAAGKLMKLRSYTYNTTNPWGVKWVSLASETETTYEAGVAVYTNVKSYAYDKYGNTTQIISTASGLETIETNIAYKTDTTNDADALAIWLINRPKSIVQTDTTNSKTLKMQTFEYYASTYSLDYGNALQYKLKQKIDWKDSINSVVSEEYAYDLYGNIVMITSPSASDSGTITKKIVYDTTYHTFPTEVADTIGTIYTAYDFATGNKTDVTDYNGYTTHYEYDSKYRNRLVAVYNEWDSTSKSGKLVQKIIYSNIGTPASQYIEKQSFYDSSSKYSFTREYFDGLNRKYKTASTGYDDNDRVVTYTYDLFGRLSKQSNPYLENYDDAVIYYTYFTYDDAGRIIQKAYDGDGIHSITTTESFAYGSGSYLQNVTFTDNKGVPHISYYDARGRLCCKSEGGATVDYEYDPLGRLTKTKDAGDNETSIEYDMLGRKKSITEKNTGKTSYTYYDSGHIKTQANQRTDDDGNGNPITITFVYDSANRLIHEYSSESAKTVDVTYTYDITDANYHSYTGLDQTNLTGRLSSVTDNSGKTIFSYDANGNVLEYVKKIIRTSSGYRVLIVKNEYDLQNRVTAITYPDGSVVKKHYADSGYLKSVTDDSDNPYVQYQREIEADYAVKRITGNGVKTTITYDPSNLRPYEVITQKPDSTVIEDVIYTQDNLGNILKLDDQIADLVHVNETETFTYDSLSRLLTAKSDNFYGNRSYNYNTQGNLISKDGKTLSYKTSRPHAVDYTTDDTTGDVQSYSYDAAGNMTSRAGKTLVYDAKNRLIKIKNASGTVIETYIYDYTGFRVRKQSSDGTVVYNLNGIYEIKFTGSGYEFTDYIYGLNGELAAQKPGGEPVVTTGVIPLVKNIRDWRDLKGLVLKISTEVNEWFKEAANLRYIFIAVLLLAILGLLSIWIYNAFFRPAHTFLFPSWMIHAVPMFLMSFFIMFGLPGCFDSIFLTNNTLAAALYYHPNHVGSIKMMTNASGNVVANYHYLPYGEIYTSSEDEGVSTKYKYTAQELDSTTGLYYYNARFYDPAIGRFISADSIVPDPFDTQAFNRYMYCVGNPIKYVDPTGHGYDYVGWNGVVYNGVWYPYGNGNSWSSSSLYSWITNAVKEFVNGRLVFQVGLLGIASSNLINADIPEQNSLGENDNKRREEISNNKNDSKPKSFQEQLVKNVQDTDENLTRKEAEKIAEKIRNYERSGASAAYEVSKECGKQKSTWGVKASGGGSPTFVLGKTGDLPEDIEREYEQGITKMIISKDTLKVGLDIGKTYSYLGFTLGKGLMIGSTADLGDNMYWDLSNSLSLDNIDQYKFLIYLPQIFRYAPVIP